MEGHSYEEKLNLLRKEEKKARQEFFHLKRVGAEKERDTAYQTWDKWRTALKKVRNTVCPAGEDSGSGMGTIRVLRYEKGKRYYAQLRGRGYKWTQKKKKELGKQLCNPPEQPSEAETLKTEYEQLEQKEQLLVTWVEVQAQDIPEGCPIRSLHKKPERVIDASPQLYQLLLETLPERTISEELYKALEQTQYPLGHKREWTLYG